MDILVWYALAAERKLRPPGEMSDDEVQAEYKTVRRLAQPILEGKLTAREGTAGLQFVVDRCRSLEEVLVQRQKAPLPLLAGYNMRDAAATLSVYRAWRERPSARLCEFRYGEGEPCRRRCVPGEPHCANHIPARV